MGDYDITLISEGGGVFMRTDKYIELTPQMKKFFGTTKAKMEPSEMISAILTMPVDLIWNGGIGVFVKASNESNFDVKDVTNDAIRVDASKLKAKIFGEGGITVLLKKLELNMHSKGV